MSLTPVQLAGLSMSDQPSYESFLPPDTFRDIESSTQGRDFNPKAGTRPATVIESALPVPKRQTADGANSSRQQDWDTTSKTTYKNESSDSTGSSDFDSTAATSANTTASYDSDEDLYESLPATTTQTPIDKPAGSDYFSDTPIPQTTRLDTDDKGKGKGKNITRQDDPKPSIPVPSLDLCGRIKGLYRILDLISEQGSGGLVDKVIIAQDSLRHFINALSPGSYATLTKVDFKALDKLSIKPIGIYGSKEELVRFLTSIDAVDRATASQLNRRSQDIGVSEPTLRSGLYILQSPKSTTAQQTFVIYWPEDTTWNDSAISTVRRNRVTFMRYLMKVSDQRVALISSHHARAIVWRDDDGDDVSMDMDEEESDRLYTFEVAKTKEQEEDVTSREGFKLSSSSIAAYEPDSGCPIDAAHFLPKLLPGETVQGFMTSRFVPPSTSRQFIGSQSFNRHQLHDLLRNCSLTISENLDDEFLGILQNCGLRIRFPKECDAWYEQRRALSQASTAKSQARFEALSQNLQDNSKQLESDLREALINQILKLYPALDHDAFIPEDAGTDDQQRSLAIERYRHLSTMYPKVGAYFEEVLQDAKLDTIKSTDFRNIKERLLVLYTLLRHYKTISDSKRAQLISIVLNDGNFQNLSRVLGDNQRASGGVIATAVSYLWGSSDSGKVEVDTLVKEARELAFKLSDPDFLQRSDKALPDEPLVKKRRCRCHSDRAGSSRQDFVGPT
ncbi:hypothetical protein EWM64_g5493 [Hericium alpestre]|uniref:Uncharacterized protein n=1 Tax=Hericium alpestre TaxID=135208 RepID=A0A4Y9ZWT3_9AGAM|nr:hypothetical protein EWM64_g5493 [Hericium alpestre]